MGRLVSVRYTSFVLTSGALAIARLSACGRTRMYFGVHACLVRINAARTGRRDGGGEGMCVHLTRAESLPDHCHWQSSNQQHQNTKCTLECVRRRACRRPRSRFRGFAMAFLPCRRRRVAAGQTGKACEGAPRTHLRCYPLLRGRAGVVGASRAHAAPRVLVLVGGPQPSCYLRQGSLILR